MQESKKLASSQNKISRPYPPKKTDSFQKSLGYSAVFHLFLIGSILACTNFDSSIWKKPPPPSSVVWTQTIKRPKPTIPDKLPPPMVPIQKVEEPKKEEINIKKPPVPEKPKVEKESAKDKMKKALDDLRKKVKEDDDRPVPKEDNFATQDKKQPDGVFSESQIQALEASSAYSSYIASVKEVVKNNFIWYKSGNNFVTIVTLRIDPQGNVLNSKIGKSSGDFAYDQAVLRAIQQSNPLPSPPTPELAKMFVQEGFDFKFERNQP